MHWPTLLLLLSTDNKKIQAPTEMVSVVIHTGSIIWVLDVGGVVFMHAYGIPPPHKSHSPNIQHPNNTACGI